MNEKAAKAIAERAAELALREYIDGKEGRNNYGKQKAEERRNKDEGGVDLFADKKRNGINLFADRG